MLNFAAPNFGNFPRTSPSFRKQTVKIDERVRERERERESTKRKGRKAH